MNNLQGNIHIRISKVQLNKLRELTEYYQTSISHIVRYFIHHGLLDENRKGSTRYVDTVNRNQRGF